MAKTYKDYCREAVARDPKTYGQVFKQDGSLRPPPKMVSFYKKKAVTNVPVRELRLMKKDGWTKADEKPELQITGTEVVIKGRKANLTTLTMPKNVSRKEYNRIWMHNSRVKKRIKKLKEQYGAATKI